MISYEYRIIQLEIEEMPLAARLSLLNTVLIHTTSFPDKRADQEDDIELEQITIKPITTSLSSLSGGDNMAYMEFRI